ncbi:MAG: saccharopine dehydrogenase NADP-binding domain-containing protein [Caldilineales bacterium]|nr:saccharopine dehydrogenase NADP-binding domain-containing protein [Caldilineales bacterium]MDW8316650.1 saccharopine dehydrogenase C-terminal domain-containing protein [Anaerolineae bacterium]
MKRVLVLGAGMVAGAHVEYLLNQPDFQVTVASRTVSKAQALVGDHPHGRALAVNSDDLGAVEALVAEHDLTVSLLPWAYHPAVARLCVKHGKHMVTTSYVKEPMAQLDQAAKAAGVILLNEIGVDPGIDHMTAMRIFHRVWAQGGRITRFVSWCGGLPAPEANTNPFGYKFSWSPRGVLLAGKNSAHYLWDGQEVVIPGEELFDHYWTVPVEVEGKVMNFDGYPNRDSLPYMRTYGVENPLTFFRGTLRYPGWCQTLRKIADLGLLSEEPMSGLAGMTFARFTARLIGSEGHRLRAALAAFLNLPLDSPVLDNLEWLGLLSDDPLPVSGDAAAPIDILTARMLEKMQYAAGERDMLILQHQIEAVYPDRTERITSTMVDFGIPHGHTSMARTVGLPAAIAVKMILNGQLDLTGVQIPVVPAIYEPVLNELEELGIRFVETFETA